MCLIVMKTLNAPKTGFTFLMQNIYFFFDIKGKHVHVIDRFCEIHPITCM